MEISLACKLRDILGGWNFCAMKKNPALSLFTRGRSVCADLKNDE